MPRQLAARPAEPSQPGDVPVRMLDIPPETFERAYNNVANSVLWFVQHLLFDTPNEPRFGREFHRDWDAYLAYNEAFADAMADEAKWDEAPPAQLRALIQDYHLSLVPRLLRRKETCQAKRESRGERRRRARDRCYDGQQEDLRRGCE